MGIKLYKLLEIKYAFRIILLLRKYNKCFKITINEIQLLKLINHYTVNLHCITSILELKMIKNILPSLKIFLVFSLYQGFPQLINRKTNNSIVYVQIL